MTAAQFFPTTRIMPIFFDTDIAKHYHRMTEITDESLMEAYKHGDAAAFNTLYAKHKGAMFRFVLRQVSDRASAEELYQDIWTRLIDSAERYEVTAKFTTYLYTIARNRIIDHYRKNGRFQIVSEEQLGEQGFDAVQQSDVTPESIADQIEQNANIRELIETLPAVQKEALLLHFEGDLTLEDIGEITGCGKETVKSRLRYAMSKMRSAIGARHE